MPVAMNLCTAAMRGAMLCAGSTCPSPAPLVAAPSAAGIHAALTHPQRWLFILTNLPYFAVAAALLDTDELPLAPDAPRCTLCSASGLGLMLGALGLVSAYWHGAQCQLMRSLYCYSEATGEARLHTPRWLKRLELGDICCSVFLTFTGVLCFGSYRTCSWIFPPFAVFLCGRFCKKNRRYRVYVFFHGAWHLFSAAAIYQIAANPRGLLG